MNNDNKNTSYLKLVEAARDLARHGLRTRNIRTQVETIGEINREKATLVNKAADLVKACQYEVEKANYQVAKLKLDANLGDPDYVDNLKDAEEFLAEMNKGLKEAEKLHTDLKEENHEAIKGLNEKIKEAETKIAKWETGENKVQLENVDKLAKEYIEKALNEKARSLSALLG